MAEELPNGHGTMPTITLAGIPITLVGGIYDNTNGRIVMNLETYLKLEDAMVTGGVHVVTHG